MRNWALTLLPIFGLSYFSKLAPLIVVLGPLLLYTLAIARHILAIPSVSSRLTSIMSSPHKLYAITIFGYKKEGMSEKDYHDYISNTHAGHLKALLAKNDIVSYTMVSKQITLFPPLP